MVERTHVLNIVSHLIMITGLVLATLPIYVVFIASTHDAITVNRVPLPLWPGGHLLENYHNAWERAEFGRAFINSLIVAAGVTVGKISLAALSAFSIVYFNYRLRMLFFWIIFASLMLPLEVRIVPTYAVVSNVLQPFQMLLSFGGLQFGLPEINLLNTYAGLVFPLVATATGTFLYRQFFLTVPDELAESAMLDGAGALRFFFDILLPLSRTNIAALATIMFVYAWNQYLWPLLIVTDPAKSTATMQLQKVLPDPLALIGQIPMWNEAMAATLLVMIPPLIVVIFMQGYFVRGLMAAEK